jgi:ABC-type polysaccharide/polyol phosphate export permease
VVVIIAAILGVALTANPLKLLGAAIFLVLGAAFFACLSMSIAGVALARDRLMGIGQAITMPLFFSSSALYPASVMPGWLQAISKVNPLTYQVEGLRGLLIGTSTILWLDGVEGLVRRRCSSASADGGTAWRAIRSRTGVPRGAAPPHSVTIQACGYPNKS